MRAPILHVIPFLWSGAGGVVTRLCESQVRRRPVILVTAGAVGELRDWPAYRRRLRQAGVTHHTIDFFSRDSAIFWSGVDRLAALLRESRPAVVHAHAGVPTAAAAIARDRSAHDARLVAQMYSWGPNRPDWMNVQDMWGFGRADRVVCSARAYWRLLVEHGVPANRLAYLPWGLALEELPFRGAGRAGPRPRQATPGKRGPVLGFVGRIEPRKSQIALVDMLSRVRRRLPDATLELVGPVADEDYARMLRAAIDRLQLRDAVTLHTRVPRVVPLLERWDLFVSLSSDEGQGLAVLEAMAVGLPVVARRVAGIEDFLVDGRTGLAVDSASTSAAARVVLAALAAPAPLEGMARRARRLVERRYAWTRMLDAFARIYGRR